MFYERITFRSQESFIVALLRVPDVFLAVLWRDMGRRIARFCFHDFPALRQSFDCVFLLQFVVATAFDDGALVRPTCRGYVVQSLSTLERRDGTAPSPSDFE